MRFRKLRIAWSVLWGLACVLLIVLWVRSYRGGDSITLYESNAEAVPLTSTKGHIELLADNDINANPYQWVDFVMNNNPERQSVSAIYAGFEVRHTWRFDSYSMPHWFAVLLSVACGAIPWLGWRYSVRTLLIATTLVAAVLGLAVYGTSKQQ
jgi:hypothetical protein